MARVPAPFVAIGAAVFTASLMVLGLGRQPLPRETPDRLREGPRDGKGEQRGGGGSWGAGSANDKTAPRAVGERPGHGTGARSPAEIPARGWWQVVKRAVSQVSTNRLVTEAAGITFYALLSIFPAITALVSIYGLFADRATIGEHLNLLGGFVPGGGMEIIGDQVKRVLASGDGALGFAAVIGLATALWSANGATKALFDALNIVYEETEKRGFVWRNLITLSFTLLGLVFAALALVAVVVLPVVLNFVGLGGTNELLVRIARWPALLVVITLLLAAIYRFGPSREDAKWRWVTWGGAFAALAWGAVSAGFSWYVQNFGNYNETYGSLGAAIGFMTWIWISATVVLTGAQLDAELERQTEHDTTTGAERPMGARGAKLADTPAPAAD